MAIGVSVIFAGYLEARRRETPAVRPAESKPTVAAPASAMTVNGHPALGPIDDPAIAFLVSILLVGSAAEVGERCRFWSVEPELISRFSREQARRVWSVRLRLPVAARTALDQLPAATQVQVADLYLEVLVPGTEAAGAPDRVPRPSAN
jgi:hypothetical protein